MEHALYELPMALSTLLTHDTLEANKAEYDQESLVDFNDSFVVPLDVYFDLHD